MCAVLILVLLFCVACAPQPQSDGNSTLVVQQSSVAVPYSETAPQSLMHTLTLTAGFYLQATDYFLQYPFGDFTALTELRQRMLNGDNWVFMFVVWLDNIAAANGTPTPLNLAQYQQGNSLMWQVPAEEAWDALYAWYGIDYVLSGINITGGSHYDGKTGSFVFSAGEVGWNEARQATEVVGLVDVGNGITQATVTFTSEAGDGVVVMYVREKETDEGMVFTLISLEGTDMVHGIGEDV